MSRNYWIFSTNTKRIITVNDAVFVETELPSNWYQNLLNGNSLTYQGNNQHDDTPSNLPLNDDNDEQMPELNEASDSEDEEEEFESEKKEECHATQVCCIEQNCLKEYSEHKCLDTTKKHINKCKQFKTGHCIGGKHIQCCIEYENGN